MRMKEVLSAPQETLTTIKHHVQDSLARLYRQRNLILHAGRTHAVALRSTLRAATPLVGAGLDRICHARFVDGVPPIHLAGRARTALTTVAPGDAAGCVSLLGSCERKTFQKQPVMKFHRTRMTNHSVPVLKWARPILLPR